MPESTSHRSLSAAHGVEEEGSKGTEVKEEPKKGLDRFKMASGSGSMFASDTMMGFRVFTRVNTSACTVTIWRL